jgi:drug/metabolite transporter (DMT)-like permease
VARAVREEISPGIATLLRQLVALPALLPLVLVGLLPKLRQLSARDWTILAALGFFGGGIHLALQWLAMHYTTAASGMLFLSTSPIFTLLLAIPLGERIGPRQWLGVAVSFAGVFLIATQGDVSRLSFNTGDLLACLSMAMWAAYTVLLRVRRDPLRVIELLTMVCAFGLLSVLPWAAWEYAAGATVALSANGVMAVLYSAFGSLLLAYAGWSYVVTRLGAARAGATMHLMPAMGIVLSAIFLREYPLWYHFVGIALILAGVAMTTLGRRSSDRPR